MLRKPPSITKLLLLLSMASLLLPLFLLPFLLHSSTSSSPPPQIHQACKATLSPPLCESTLSQSPSLPPIPTPTDLILAAAAASASHLSTARSLSQSLLSSATAASNPSLSTAARNCLDHLSLSSHRLSAALSSSPSSAHHLAGAALLYQYDCWSALKYVNSSHSVADAMSVLSDLISLSSAALSMIAALRRFGPDLSLWIPPQTERDGYFPDPPAAVADSAIAFPSDLPADLTVCQSGDCDFRTIQEAVAAAPDYGSRRFVIYIKSGIYQETVKIPFEKTNLAFLGDGMGKTVITGSLNAQMPGISTYNTATVAVAGDGFIAKDLTFENSAGPGAHQAVAFLSDSDKSILNSVEFVGHQDTLWARSLRQLYINCRISGTVDFIFGNSAAVFQNCTILVVPRLGSPEKGESNAVTAHGRTDPGQPTGFVFKNCIVNGSEEYVEIYRRRPGRHKVYLGRPWKEYSRVVFVECYLEEVVSREGWMPWRGEFGLKTLYYGEYGSLGPGGGDVGGRVGWSSQVPAEHLGVYSLKEFLQGDEWLVA